MCKEFGHKTRSIDNFMGIITQDKHNVSLSKAVYWANHCILSFSIILLQW